MRSTPPHVQGERLYRSETESDPIVLETPEWYDWLEHHVAFTFVDPVGTFTARKSMLRTGGSYWKAYCKRQGKLYRIHLGHSHTLTLEKLQATAQAFAGGRVSEKHADVSVTQSAASRNSMYASPRKALTVDHSMALIQTKLYRPRKRSDLISRLRLLDRLNAGLSGKITLVSAPAGFGKTTLIAQWVQTIDPPTAWLSLDEHDNELAIFVHSLVAALQSAVPDMFHGIASLLHAPTFPSVEYVVSLFLNDLADLPEDLFLVLDDFHLIHTRDIQTLLDALIEHLPPQVHLVLISRSDPPLPIHRWRAKGYLNDLRPPDLRFTLEETEAFLKHALGNAVTPEACASLQDRTGGWIAVLRLAALSLRNTSDITTFMDHLQTSTDHSIQGYLVEEVLTTLEPDVQDVLMKASIVEQFSAEVCMAMTNSDLSVQRIQATLDWLERSNVFLIRVDERQGWYRFHHLFGHLLKQRLEMVSSAEELALLHRRASRWYAEHGLIEQAIGHALRAGDVSGATSLVEAQFLLAFGHEQWVQIEHWLRLLPEEQIQGSPLLLFARMWILQVHGQLQDFPLLLAAASRLLATSRSDASALGDPQHRLMRTLIAIAGSHFQYFTGQMQASLESARSALQWLPPGEEYVASAAVTLLAWSHQALGQEDVALLELSHALSARSAHLNSTVRLLFAQGVVYLAAGKLHQVEHTARHLLQIAQEADAALSQQFAHWFLGIVYYEWNNLDAAIYHFSAVITNRHQAHFWMVQDALRGLVLAYQAQGLGTQAQETAATLLAVAQEQHNRRELLTAYAFCGRLALVQGEMERAEQWLEMAGEQPVLGPMPFLEDPPITRAWLLLAKGDEASGAHGQALLTHLLRHVEAIHSTRKLIEVLALQAWAYDLQGRESEAVQVLERALTLARPGGFIRTFADLVPLARLIHVLRKQRRSRKALDRKADAYLQQILVAMKPDAVSAVSTDALLLQEGLEPLTASELRILCLLDSDFTNKEIARELVLTTGTVKVHISNVYRKLSVNNRRAAVSLAKALGFLAAS